MPKKHINYVPRCVVKVYKGVPVSNSQYKHLQTMNQKDIQTLLYHHLESYKMNNQNKHKDMNT